MSGKQNSTCSKQIHSNGQENIRETLKLNGLKFLNFRTFFLENYKLKIAHKINI